MVDADFGISVNFTASFATEAAEPTKGDVLPESSSLEADPFVAFLADRKTLFMVSTLLENDLERSCNSKERKLVGRFRLHLWLVCCQ
jgi:hypothetical protein